MTTTTSLDLRAFRMVNSLSQEAVAQLLGVSVKTVARWEAHETVPSPLARMALAHLETRVSSS